MFKWSTDRRRRQLFDQLRPLILKGMEATCKHPNTIVQAAVKEYNAEEGRPTGHVDTTDEGFIEQVFCQLMIFFFGGEDAVSIVIPWMIHRLASNPDCLHKLRLEHDKILGPDPALAMQKIQEAPLLLDSLQYSHAVIKETLRLNPATITIREGQPDFLLAIQGSDIRWPTHGFDLFDSSITIHRDPRNFVRPLDFLPERFLVPEGHELRPPKNTWRGFQLGPRHCIGKEFAIVLLKLVLVSIVREFDIELAWDEWDASRECMGMEVSRHCVEGERMYTTGKATSHPKDGGPVHVRMRK